MKNLSPLLLCCIVLPVLFAGCFLVGAPDQGAPPPLPTQTVTLAPVATLAATDTPAPLPMQTPSQEPTPDPWMPGVDDTQLALETIRQVDLYLKSQEPYTAHYLFMTQFAPFGFIGDVYPGVMGAYELPPENAPQKYIANVQGILLGYFPAGDGVVLFMGMYDRAGQRIVTPLKVYRQSFLPALKGYPISKVRGNAWSSQGQEQEIVETPNRLFEILDSQVGRALGFQIDFGREPAVFSDEKKREMSAQGADPDAFAQVWNELISADAACKSLVLNAWRPAAATTDLIAFLTGLGEADPLLTVSTVEEMQKVIAPGLWLPNPTVIRYWVY